MHSVTKYPLAKEMFTLKWRFEYLLGCLKFTEINVKEGIHGWGYCIGTFPQLKVQAEYVVVGGGAGEVARHEDAERQAGPRHHLALAHLQAHDLK